MGLKAFTDWLVIHDAHDIGHQLFQIPQTAIVMSEPPIPEHYPIVPTLMSAQVEGSLRPLNRTKLRAQFGMLDGFKASDVRRAIALMLGRLLEYYSVIQYTGPGYVYGRVDSSWPSSLECNASHNYMDNSWCYREMHPSHPTCSIESVFSSAGWMCVETACKIARNEIAQDVPEATEVFLQASYAINSMLYERSISNIAWSASRRRLGTPGVRKALKRLQVVLPSIQIGLGPIRPAVLAQSQIGRSTFGHVREWSIPEIAA